MPPWKQQKLATECVAVTEDFVSVLELAFNTPRSFQSLHQ